ncbi:MAG: BON domain-containing protein [Armatimonas sp.]
MRKVLALSALLAIGATMLAGCPKTQEAAQQAANAGADAASSAGKAAAGAAQGAANSAADAGKAAGAAADNAGAAAMNGMANAAKGVTGALDTAKIKGAIVADAALNDPANEINVDVTDKAVFLKGHVKNNDLKKKAGEIATKQVKEAGSSLEVKNTLLVK